MYHGLEVTMIISPKHLQISDGLDLFQEELQDLTWIEELLITRVHVCGSIVRLGQRNNPSSFFGIKGHVVFLIYQFFVLLTPLNCDLIFLKTYWRNYNG